MKKMTAFLVTLCMLAALLAGCGGKGGDDSNGGSDQTPPPRRRMALTMIWRAPNRKTAD